MIKKAPVRIYFWMNIDNYKEKYASAIDIGMFSQNFILKAFELGLSTCPMYGSENLIPSQKEARNAWGLKKNYYCYLSILVGYGAELAEKPPRRKIKNIVVFDHIDEE